MNTAVAVFIGALVVMRIVQVIDFSGEGIATTILAWIFGAWLIICALGYLIYLAILT